MRISEPGLSKSRTPLVRLIRSDSILNQWMNEWTMRRLEFTTEDEITAHKTCISESVHSSPDQRQRKTYSLPWSCTFWQEEWSITPDLLAGSAPRFIRSCACFHSSHLDAFTSCSSCWSPLIQSKTCIADHRKPAVLFGHWHASPFCSVASGSDEHTRF